MILVTGSSGLVGSHLLYYLLRKGKHVKALIRNELSKDKIRKVFLYYAKDANQLLTQINWHFGDVTDLVSLEEAFENVEYVYHCAATISFNNKDRSLMHDVNINGTANIVNLCLSKGIKKLVHVSSIAAIAKSGTNGVYTEDGAFPTGKLSAYSYTKTQSELKVWQGIAEGLNAVIINPSVILGPGNWASGSGKLFSQVYKGMKFYTRGITGFVDVRDVSKLMIKLMESQIHSERFILNADNLSYERLFKMIATEMGVKPPRYYAPPFLTSLAWRIEKFLSIVLFKEPMLTKHSAKASHAIQNYSSAKIIEHLDYRFMRINDSISSTSHNYLDEKRSLKKFAM